MFAQSTLISYHTEALVLNAEPGAQNSCKKTSATKPLLVLHGVELCVTYDSCDAFVKVKFKVFVLLRRVKRWFVGWTRSNF